MPKTAQLINQKEQRPILQNPADCKARTPHFPNKKLAARDQRMASSREKLVFNQDLKERYKYMIEPIQEPSSHVHNINSAYSSVATFNQNRPINRISSSILPSTSNMTVPPRLVDQNKQ